ncbi:type II secretion system protein [Phascolarctobacterium sp.]|uniref:type II secretion system protein n=1 Tax=Phascolarctobacterium sp. TaxID=2049039 RepID=UPI0025DD4704|nr:prepilin-type N-terminal cleavage/methylation domain-containing protein [Phascolarctobacterium sp.]
MRAKKGFTLIELVVVIAILGILAGIAIPRFMDSVETARGAKLLADLRSIESAGTVYYTKNGNVISSSQTVVNVKNDNGILKIDK